MCSPPASENSGAPKLKRKSQMTPRNKPPLLPLTLLLPVLLTVCAQESPDLSPPLAQPAIPSSAGTGPGQSGGDTLNVLVNVFSRTDDAGGQPGKYADQIRVAGLACERSYDALTQH